MKKQEFERVFREDLPWIAFEGPTQALNRIVGGLSSRGTLVHNRHWVGEAIAVFALRGDINLELDEAVAVELQAKLEIVYDVPRRVIFGNFLGEESQESAWSGGGYPTAIGRGHFVASVAIDQSGAVLASTHLEKGRTAKGKTLWSYRRVINEMPVAALPAAYRDAMVPLLDAELRAG